MRLCYIIALILISESVHSTPSISVVTEDLWPFNYFENNEIKGGNTEKVKKLLECSKIDYEIELLPWARAYKIATTQPNILIYTINRTLSREAKFHWIGKLSPPTDLYLYALKSSNYQKLSDDSLKKLRVGTQIGSANYTYLVNNNFENISNVGHLRQTVGMLNLGRVDLIIASEQQLLKATKEMNVGLDKIVRLKQVFQTIPFIAASLSTPIRLVEKLRKNLKCIEL